MDDLAHSEVPSIPLSQLSPPSQGVQQPSQMDQERQPEPEDQPDTAQCDQEQANNTPVEIQEASGESSHQPIFFVLLTFPEPRRRLK